MKLIDHPRSHTLKLPSDRIALNAESSLWTPVYLVVGDLAYNLIQDVIKRYIEFSYEKKWRTVET
jgi:hypothetical protein